MEITCSFKQKLEVSALLTNDTTGKLLSLYRLVEEMV